MRNILCAFYLVFIGAWSTFAQAEGLNASTPEDLVRGWVKTVVSGDAEAIAGILAPEFQLVRGSGKAHDRESYVAGGLPNIAEPPEVADIVGTSDGDLQVVRYWLVIDQTVDGQALQRRAPRLTVFRRIDGNWYVSAHANFSLPR